MRTKLILALAVGLLAVTLRADDAGDDLAIIVNKASKLENVSSSDLTKYFRADKTKAPDGTKLLIVMQDQGRPEREAALKSIYKMSESEYANHFVEATFTGAVAAAPKSLPSSAAVKTFVAATAGGLGYVRGSDVGDSVKALKIDGKAPGDAEYKLKIK